MRQGLQALREGRDGIEAYPDDAPIAQVHDCQRLQRVVQQGGGEIDIQILRAPHPRGVLEVPHAVLVEHHTLDGQPTGGCALGVCRRRGRLLSMAGWYE